VEWIKVKALSLNPSTANKQKKIYTNIMEENFLIPDEVIYEEI
jgi:hypothetical protein